jgi:hypothetical protein
MRALQAVAAAERTGPLVVDDEGLPLRRRNYQDLNRDIANAAGLLGRCGTGSPAMGA